MAGTGETWPHLLKRYPNLRSIVAVDISSGMVKGAIGRLHALRSDRIEIIENDILKIPLEAEFADFVVCTFGLKTFKRDQQSVIAAQVARILKSGGVFSFVEASDPHSWILRPFYNYYLRTALPMIEKTFLRGAQDFAMLGVYSKAFLDCTHFATCLETQGLEIKFEKYFFGCATGVTGRKIK